MRKQTFLIILGALLGLLLLAHILLLPYSSAMGTHISLYLLTFLPYAGVILLIRNKSFPLKTILVFAILFRCIAVATPPVFSDDIYRYLWEGKMIQNAINPYNTSPADAASKLPPDSYYSRINHKEIPTVYPPLSQGVFALIAGFSYHPRTFKTVWMILDLILIGLLLQILRQRRLPLNRVAVYAWNPLTIIETSGSGHQDIIGIVLLWTAIYLIVNSKNSKIRLSIVALTGSFLSKLTPIVLLPLFLRNHPKKYYMILPVLSAFAFMPFFINMDTSWLGLSTYLQHWEFNSFAYWILGSIISSQSIVKIVLLILFGIIFVQTFRKEKDLITSGFIIMGTLLLCLPTLHPWYVLWIIPFLCFQLNPAWLLFTGLVTLSYSVLIPYQQSGIWEENTMIRILEYIPFYVLLILWKLRQRRQA